MYTCFFPFQRSPTTGGTTCHATDADISQARPHASHSQHPAHGFIVRLDPRNLSFSRCRRRRQWAHGMPLDQLKDLLCRPPTALISTAPVAVIVHRQVSPSKRVAFAHRRRPPLGLDANAALARGSETHAMCYDLEFLAGVFLKLWADEHGVA
ncbi:hypothetical protein BCR44DRAFT_1434288 [Catenaria anguillulae PL171]|uniref:Uncharacterized protein n=1 Tax=Catenaria anguillulae PL171 TaxID=765915 RepID=A0A1Y2HLM6_9FUNG|nr:hypothetical protein BCR44DRAFT_1434288 [Catenaria anguillulae PL171]